MFRAKDGWTVATLAIVLFTTGCDSKAPAPYPRYGAVPGNRNAPQGAFAALVSAAQETEKKCPDSLNRTTWTPQAQAIVVGQLSGPLQTLFDQRKSDVQFDYHPTKPFEEPPLRAGWGLLGKAAGWKVRLLVEAEAWGEAAEWYLAATKFGFDLMGGNARDASLGLLIADGARQAFLPAMGKLTPSQLQKLYADLQDIDQRRPNVAQMVRNDALDMLEVVQYVQDAYRDNSYDAMRKNLGRDIEPAIDALEKLRSQDSHKRAAYFENFAKEAEATTAFRLEIVGLDGVARAKQTPPAVSADRPWKRFSRYFFRGAESVFTMADSTIARTRLVGLHASIRATILTQGKGPASLDTFPNPFAMDPHTGSLFVLHADGKTYRLYSAGLDARDDGGETDSSFASPDLTLETHDL